MSRLQLESDYMDGTHPEILEKIVAANGDRTTGYGEDPCCEQAREKILQACGCPDGQVFFCVGGTQTNSTVIDAYLRPWEGVVAAETGHIATHEAGAVEMNGHKVIPLPHSQGKVTSDALHRLLEQYASDPSRDHIVKPGLVYLSHPTEFGTLYSLEELTALSELCRSESIPLFLDGARLAYALSAPGSDVSLRDLAALCDCFYIGGTKCGALLGEAVVFPKGDPTGHFFSIMKRHGAVLAKGRLLGITFGALFTDDLYGRIGLSGVTAAGIVLHAVREKGWDMPFPAQANQIFCRVPLCALPALGEICSYSLWEQSGSEALIRLTCSWSVSRDDAQTFARCLAALPFTRSET